MITQNVETKVTITKEQVIAALRSFLESQHVQIPENITIELLVQPTAYTSGNNSTSVFTVKWSGVING